MTTPRRPTHSVLLTALRRVCTLALVVLAATGLVACLDPATPQRVITGVITDTQDRPIPGARVALGEHHAVTDARGAFELRGIDIDARGPLTALAPGHTAWTLDTDRLTRFTARLKPRSDTITTALAQRPLNLRVAFPDIVVQERRLLVQSDLGALSTVRIPAGFDTYDLTLALPAGAKRLTVLAPAADLEPALWAPSVALPSAASNAGLTVSLTAATINPITVRPLPQGLPSNPDDTFELVARCGRDGNVAQLVVGQYDDDRSAVTLLERDPRLELELFVVDALTRCDLILSFDLPYEDRTIQHVAFASDLPPPPTLPSPYAMALPPAHPLVPTLDDGMLAWPAAPNADLYDVYIAPTGDPVGDPIWSATTERTTLALPVFPDAVLDALDVGADAYAVRVVARYAPGLDIEDRWDWSNYYGYIASPWITLPDSALTRWR